MSTAAAPASSRTANPSPAATMAAALITAMLKSYPKASDLIFSPGRTPQVEGSTGLITPPCGGLRDLTPKDTERLAAEIIGEHRVAAIAEGAGLRRPFLQHSPARSLSGEHLPAAGQLRSRVAGHLP